MGLESNPTPPSSSASSPTGKRSRDPDDEVYLDNFHSHKRYLSEIMASSLNGLKVGDPLPENLMDSQSRPESMLYLRDETSLQYSPMSEDLDDSRFSDTATTPCSSQPESLATSPVSPYRYQKPLSGYSSNPSTSSHPSHNCPVTLATPSSQPRQRGSDSEGRFPSSPSDICHSADLRRAALLRSVMRTQPLGHSALDISCSSVQEPGSNVEANERPGTYMKSLVDEREYQIEECSSMGIPEPEFNQEKSCRILNLNVEEHESRD